MCSKAICRLQKERERGSGGRGRERGREGERERGRGEEGVEEGGTITSGIKACSCLMRIPLSASISLSLLVVSLYLCGHHIYRSTVQLKRFRGNFTNFFYIFFLIVY